MRVFLGIVLGVLLTIAAAYVHDLTAGPGSSAASQTLVNWDVVRGDWQGLRAGVRELGNRIQDQWAKR